MKYFRYEAIRDNDKVGGNPYWQVWVWDSREKARRRLAESMYHTKSSAHALAALLNHEMHEFVALNNGDVTLVEKAAATPAPDSTIVPASAAVLPAFWSRFFRFFSALVKR